MNTHEQKHHKTVTDELRQDIKKLAEAFDKELEENTVAIRSDYRKEIGEERTARLKLAEEQRSYVDGEDKELRRRLDAVVVELKQHKAFFNMPWHRRWLWTLFGLVHEDLR